MADGRDSGVWSEHARRDHTKIDAYVGSHLVDNLLKLTKNVNTVWDLGCGSGLWRPVFKNYNYVGIDQNTDMLDVAVKRDFSYIEKTTQFIQSNLRTPFNLKAQKPDLVWFSAVLQHNRHEPDKREILENISSLLTKGKYLMFTENTFTPLNYNPPFLSFFEGCTDGWSFTQKGWIDYIEEFGFKIIENNPFNFYLFIKK